MIFVVAGVHWSLPSAHIARVALATALLPVAAHEGMPAAVVGVVHSEGEVLTVVDAAALMGGAPSVTTSRSRLISLASESSRGFALLVDRVLERVPAGSARDTAREFHLNALSGAL
jgi:chemotaxis signal transduction protein